MMQLRRFAIIALTLVLPTACPGLIFVETGDPTFHSSTPGDNSGWQYQGKFGPFGGVPIGPYHFISAIHIGNPSPTFDFHGDSYTTIGFTDDLDLANQPRTDLRIWEVDHAKPFPDWAPLFTGSNESGMTATIMGRGTVRGGDWIVSGELKGWFWGGGSSVLKWGRNVVAGTMNGGGGVGQLLYCNFDSPGISGECTFSNGDSSAGTFLPSGNLWRLAAINYAVDGPFRESANGTTQYAAVFDEGGLWEYNGVTFVPVANTANNIPTSFYASRISSSLTWIRGVVGTTYIDNLAAENFSAWQHLYFTPAEISNTSVSGELADYDGDGIKNLIEFALNLDPTYPEPVIMTAGSGLRGLPLIKRETVSGQEKLTVEFVRRTLAGGAGLTYTAQFSSDMVNWTTGTQVGSTTSLNTRWDRVKFADTVVATSTAKRFARVKVQQ